MQWWLTATHCDTTHCNTLQHITLQQIATIHARIKRNRCNDDSQQHTATQHTATHCNTLQSIATIHQESSGIDASFIQHGSGQDTATHCNTTTHCNHSYSENAEYMNYSSKQKEDKTLQHTVTVLQQWCNSAATVLQQCFKIPCKTNA